MHSALLLAIAALPFLGADALKCSTTARCGTQSKNTLTCKKSVWGNCCSKSGYCGSTSLHCGTGCQVGFGDCTSAKPSALTKLYSTSTKPSTSSTSTLITSSTSSAKVIVVSVRSVSTSSTPSIGSTSILSTVTSSSVLETSSSSPTPSSAAVTSSSLSTPSSAPVTSSSLSTPSPASETSFFSSTLSSSVPPASSSSVPDVKISTDASCGGTQGFTCLGSQYGNCCSEYNWCGSTSIYCDAGCNAAFGECNAVSPPAQTSSSSTTVSSSSTLAPSSFTTSTRTSSATPSATQVVSTGGSCGASSDGMTCLGSQFGDCCSQYNYCGNTNAFCGTGCQSGFGNCDPAPVPGDICGVEGFANKAEYYASSFNLIPTADVSTCATLCLAEATCMSYLFNVDLQNCAYLTYSLSQGEFIATTGTNQLFWDRACAEPTTV